MAKRKKKAPRKKQEAGAFQPFEAQITLFSIVDFMLCQTIVPMEMIDALNVELDRVRADKNKESHGHTLVGQMKRGEQLGLPREKPVFGKVYSMVEQLDLCRGFRQANLPHRGNSMGRSAVQGPVVGAYVRRRLQSHA